MTTLLRFPNPVNEVSARFVAGGVTLMALAYAITGRLSLLVVLAYGFVARVLSGPRFSPLALFVTRVLTPRLRQPERPVPGPPKRFAQGIGAVLSLTAVALAMSLETSVPARAVIVALAAAATLESVAGFCLGCAIFGWLMRRGIIPAKICTACTDIRTARTPRPSSANRASTAAVTETHRRRTG
jgi:hypothetical protein